MEGVIYEDSERLDFSIRDRGNVERVRVDKHDGTE